MKIELRLPERLDARLVPRTYDPEFDDVESLFIDAPAESTAGAPLSY